MEKNQTASRPASITAEEALIILEAARVALADAEVFDQIAEKLDVADSLLQDVAEKLSGHMAEADAMPIHLAEGDYVLAEGAAWFTAGSFSVRVFNDSPSVSVDIYLKGREMENPLDSGFACEESQEQEAPRTPRTFRPGRVPTFPKGAHGKTQ